MLNHHSAAIFPYFIDDKLRFITEQKDPGYKPPFFDNGLNLLGGNWQRGDSDPKELLQREINEEFWRAYEGPESLNNLLSQEFLHVEPNVIAQYDTASVKRIGEIADILSENEHMGDFIVTVKPPITNDNLTYAASVFGKELTKEEYTNITKILDEFNNQVTTDNLKRGNKTIATTIEDCNLYNSKFAWGYDHILNHLNEKKIIRPLSLVEVEPVKAGSFADFAREYGYR